MNQKPNVFDDIHKEKPNKMRKIIQILQDNLYIPYVLIFISFLAILAVAVKLTSTVSSIFIFIFENLIFICLGLFCFIFIHNKKQYANKIQSTDCGRFFKLSSTIIFIIISLSLFLLKNTPYTKPLIYYILISLGIVIIGMEIFFMKLSKNHSNGILLQILGIGSVIRFSNFIIHPYIYASDPYYHYYNAMTLIKTGFLSIEFGHYYFYPVHTIFNGASTILGNLDSTLFLLPATISIIFSIILVNLIGKSLFNNQIGLLAALFLIFGNFYFPSPSYQPTLFGINLLLLAIYSIIHISRTNQKSWWAIFWLSALSTLFVHPVNTLVLLIFLGINFILDNVYNNKEMRIRNAPFLSFMVMYIAYLIFVSSPIFTSIVNGIFIPEYVPALTTTISKNVTPSSTYIVEMFTSYVGNSSKLFLLVPAIFLVMRKPTKEKLVISIFLIILNFIPLFEVIRGSFNLQSTRILLYFDVIVVFLLGYGFYELVTSIKSRRTKFIIIFICLSIMSFFSLTSYLFGDENEIFSKELPIQTLFTTDSTLASHNYLIRIPSGNNISMDYGTSSYIFGPENRAPLVLHNLNFNQFDIDSSMNNTYIIINYNTMPKGTFTNSGLRKFGRSMLDVNFEYMQGISKIYSNDIISIYL